ncbi:ribosomal subunit interface protein [Pseudomonas alcaligenes]|uniref:Ribosomal subunit interface protein n=1 Tax=Aquipseudomonas alcaligenes TaxID=43263 RepID=A0ABR7S2K5_AQUAC|nr:HPF/RaiA family ribosome-associated protein [Pseudomonas alcaligenes]MBC9251816.1 ribosomal subunit interface protein [Pseudomonas alcaligenes]
MQVQVHTNQVEGSARLQEWVSTEVMDKLDHFDEFLTRVVVHISDENAHKAGADDKRCHIEARPKGHQPISVTHKADQMGIAVDGAAEKMRHALEHLTGRLEAKVVSTGRFVDPTDVILTDALLEEEFLARQEELDQA